MNVFGLGAASRTMRFGEHGSVFLCQHYVSKKTKYKLTEINAT